MIGERLARDTVGAADVDLVCALNKDHELDEELDRLQLSPAQADKACPCRGPRLPGKRRGSRAGAAALTSPSDDEVEIAQVYLHHRPIDRSVTSCAPSPAGSRA